MAASETEPRHGTSLLDLVTHVHQHESDHPRRKTLDAAVFADAVDESPFHLASTRATTKLSLDELIQPLQASAQTTSKTRRAAAVRDLAALRHDTRAQTLAPALSTAHRQRLERKAAYDSAKEHVSRWEPMVHRNRAAEHLVFPLDQRGGGTRRKKQRTTKTFVPTNSLERDLDKLIARYDKAQHRETTHEALPTHHVTETEAATRRAKLAKMRSLMFHDEIKQKHRAKIKSRSYRRVQRKKREREQASRAEMAALDGTGQEEEEAEAEKREMQRIRERISLKHSNTSKWVKERLRRARERKGADDQDKDAFRKQQKLKEALVRKMDTVDSDASRDDDDDDAVPAPAPANETRGVFGLKFMQRAMEKEKEAAEQARVEAAAAIADASGSDDAEAGPSQAVPRRQGTSTLAPNTVSVVTQGTRQPAMQFESAAFSSEEDKEEEEEEEEEEEDKEAPAPAAKRQRRSQKKKTLLRMGDTDDAFGTAAASGTTPLTLDGSHDPEQQALISRAFSTDAADYESEFAKIKRSEIEAELAALEQLDGTTAATRGATALPGWGSWGGQGAPKRRKSAAQRKREKELRRVLAARRRAKLSARTDAGLAHVVVNQQIDQKLLAYAVPTLPFPFTSVEEFDAAQRHPLGSEWNTAHSHRTLVQPRVVVQPGALLEPATFNPALGRENRKREVQRQNRKRKRRKLTKI